MRARYRVPVSTRALRVHRDGALITRGSRRGGRGALSTISDRTILGSGAVEIAGEINLGVRAARGRSGIAGMVV